MTLDQYQEETARTSTQAGDDLRVLALGIAGEAGEIADLVKKHFGQGHPLNEEKIGEEIGDCLWYLARMCHVLGYSFEWAAAANIVKLRKRYPDGFDPQRSINR